MEIPYYFHIPKILYEFFNTKINLKKGDDFGKSRREDGKIIGYIFCYYRHIPELFYKNITLLENGIKPIWIFNPTNPNNKLDELAFNNEYEEKKIEKDSIKEIINSSINIIRLMGLPVFQSISRPDAECAMLSKNGIVDGVVSENIDPLVYGGKVLLRKFKNGKNSIIEIELENMLKELELTYEQFVDLNVLAGCCYVLPINKIGSVTALKLINKSGYIENSLNYI